MKISVNDRELFTLTETQKAVIKNDIHADEFDADMERRLQWILTHKYERCFDRLKKEWDQKLPSLGVASVPTDKDAYANLVFAQPCYKCRKTRDLEAKAAEEARLAEPTVEV
jgi:hypothetical protein